MACVFSIVLCDLCDHCALCVQCVLAVYLCVTVCFVWSVFCLCFLFTVFVFIMYTCARGKVYPSVVVHTKKWYICLYWFTQQSGRAVFMLSQFLCNC